MKNRPDLRLVVNRPDDSQKIRKNGSAEGDKTLAERFFDSSTDAMDTTQKPPGYHKLPPTLQRELDQQREKAKQSLDSFEEEYNARIGELKLLVQELRNLAEAEKIKKSTKASTVLLQQIKEIEKYLSDTGSFMRDKYQNFSEEEKRMSVAQELRDTTLETLDQIITSTGKMIGTIKDSL